MLLDRPLQPLVCGTMRKNSATRPRGALRAPSLLPSPQHRYNADQKLHHDERVTELRVALISTADKPIRGVACSQRCEKEKKLRGTSTHARDSLRSTTMTAGAE
jgi:hypothetical protein